MTTLGQPASSHADAQSPASFLAAAAALEAIDSALRGAQHEPPDTLADGGTGPERALASLLLLRQIREELAGWETGLIETARHAGASWADLAHPLGVASRQAAERRYLRNRPGPAGTTAEQRVQATRERRAADRTLVTWARDNAADLRRIAGQITALTDLPTAARLPLSQLDAALAYDDPAALIHPLNAARPHLTTTHPDLAARLDTLTESATAPSATPD
ncbi:type III effector protein [Streptomyces cinnamoneus]|uniref:Type III effector protein n=1 Tax=Streptomyces cinnamoneus TaxID=53446 RepID=A0A2G1XJM9_STRCJ|nr:type III effector protein [Streptomyces cinnamoneus]PHQ51458.1 type III effector protein [Streptomyces cinnamoneus]PHQ51462.1 type III effector protein [Streptomyces cinnamoneus]PPT11645.1 type III effector protein [Streptomyces cinnamoneus]